MKIKGCSLCKDLINPGYDSPKGKKYQPYGNEYGIQIIDERAVDNVKSFILRLTNENSTGVWCPIKFCPICGRDLSIQNDYIKIIDEIISLVEPLKDAANNDFYDIYYYKNLDEEGESEFLSAKIRPLLKKLKLFARDSEQYYDTSILDDLSQMDYEKDFQLCVDYILDSLNFMKENDDIRYNDIVMIEVIISYFDNEYD